MIIKKICCYMFLLVLLVNAPISAYAQASSSTPTVTIAAGTGAAVGGAYQGYTSKTAAAATALTIAILSATGAAVKLTEASVQAGKTVYQVINDKFAQWVGGTSAEELTPSQAEELQSRFKVITGGGGNQEDPDNDQNNGTNIDQDGKLWFSPGSLSMLKKFCDWLESTDQLKQEQQSSQGTTQNDGYGETIVGTTVTYQAGYYSGTLTSTIPCGLYKSNSWIAFVSDQPFKVNGTDATLRSHHYVYGVTFTNNITSINPSNMLNLTMTFNNFWKGLSGHTVTEPQPVIPEDGIYRGSNYNDSLLDNENNQKLVVDPGILNGFDIDSDRQITIPDYIDLIIQQAEEKAKRNSESDTSPAPQELPVPLLDPLTGTKSPANWIDPEPDDAIEDPIESEKRDPDPEDPKDPVIDDDTPTDPEDAIELMKVDLTRIFPFCIPWDLYRLLTKFNAEPVTPSITIDWGDILGTFGIDYVTTLDLHDYDNVASILRTMETVAFVVGLAVATRSIFLRS